MIGPGAALPVPPEQRGLPPQAARLQHRRGPRLPVQLRLLATNCEYPNIIYAYSYIYHLLLDIYFNR